MHTPEVVLNKYQTVLLLHHLNKPTHHILITYEIKQLMHGESYLNRKNVQKMITDWQTPNDLRQAMLDLLAYVSKVRMPGIQLLIKNKPTIDIGEQAVLFFKDLLKTIGIQELPEQVYKNYLRTLPKD